MPMSKQEAQRNCAAARAYRERASKRRIAQNISTTVIPEVKAVLLRDAASIGVSLSLYVSMLLTMAIRDELRVEYSKDGAIE